MCAPLLSTCTLNRKSRHNKSGTSAFGGMWKISFQNFHTGVFPCYVWTPMHMLALGAWPGMESCSINCNWAFLPRTSKLQWGDATFPAGKSVYGSCNTFFDVGATYYGPPPRRHVTRIDYICVPESCLQKVSRCHVQYMAADSLQLICDCARRDHVPLQIEIDLQLEFAGVAANTRKTWDAEPLVLDALVGKRREALFNAVDRQLETHVGTSTILADKPCNPDILWTKVATALQAATEEIYPPKQRKHSDRPLDTQDANETMLQKRAQLVSFRPKMLGNGRFRFDCGSPFTSNRLCKIFCWYGARDVNIDRHGRRWMTAQKGTQKPDKSRNSTNFSFAWGQRDLHQAWKTARQLSGKPIGPKRRRYDAAKSAWPEKAEWVAFLQQSGPAGGCSAVELDVDSFEVVEDEASVPVMDCTTARELAKSDLRALRRCARGSTLRKTCPPVFQPKFGGNSCCHSGRWIWLQVVLAFQGKFGNQHCFTAYFFTCLCPYDFTTEPLTRGSEATQQLWTNVMANLGLLACASSTTWKFWESGILTACGKGEVLLLRETTLLGTREASLEPNPCYNRTFSNTGCANKVFPMLFLSWMSPMLFPALIEGLCGARWIEWLAASTINCCNRDMRAPLCTLLLEMGMYVYSRILGACKGILLRVLYFWRCTTPNWISGCKKPNNMNFWFKIPYRMKLLDISVSSYADDVARCTVAESSEELFLHITHSNDVLDTALGEIGLKQNTDKQEHIVYFSGAGANSYLAHIYKEGMLPGKSCVSAKYLGGWRHFKGSNDMEIRARRRAAEIGFMAMGKFLGKTECHFSCKNCFLCYGSQCCLVRS